MLHCLPYLSLAVLTDGICLENDTELIMAYERIHVLGERFLYLTESSLQLNPVVVLQFWPNIHLVYSEKNIDNMRC